jgi:hypothetical protein
MKFSLITKTGKIMQFYIRATAEVYQMAYGGVLFDETIIDSEFPTIKEETE